MIVILKISDDSWIKKVFEKLARYQGKKIDDAVANFLVEVVMEKCVNDPYFRNDFCNEITKIRVEINTLDRQTYL